MNMDYKNTFCIERKCFFSNLHPHFMIKTQFCYEVYMLFSKSIIMVYGCTLCVDIRGQLCGIGFLLSPLCELNLVVC